MRRRTTIGPIVQLALQATVIVALTMFARTAHATSCAMPTPDNGDEYADVVFEAVASGDAEPGKARLAVGKVYKGSVPETVVTPYGGMKTYGAFETDQRYLVFGMVDDEGALWVSLCSATHRLPAEGMFAEGPWQGWSPVRRYGRPRPAGGSLTSGKRPDHGDVPPPTPSTTAAPTPVAPTPDPISSPSAAPPTASPHAPGTSGCAGCAVGRDAPIASWPAWLLLVLGLGRRRRAPARPRLAAPPI